MNPFWCHSSFNFCCLCYNIAKVLLRGVGPNDPDYHRDDIVRNVRIFLEENSLSVMVEKGKYNDETVITEFIPKQCIETRKLALDAMKGGYEYCRQK